MFQNLSEKLESAFHHLTGQNRITDLNISNTIKDIRRALIDADVNFKIAKEFTDKIKEKSIGQKLISSIRPSQMMVKIVQDELVELMGKETKELSFKNNPTIILIAGLQGSGKTTFSAKFARFLKEKHHKNPLLVAADTYRPAAIDQLELLGQQISVPVYTQRENPFPIEISISSIEKAKELNCDCIIIDTAGRLAIDETMMNEVASIKEKTNPHYILFVVDAMTGQDAVNTAKAFHDTLDFTGVVLTKLDGDTRGGAALSIQYTVEKPIYFMSNGEKLDALEIFHPDRMAQRILGMGDIVSFVEKAQSQFDEEQAKKLEKKIKKNQFNFQDFLEQIEQIQKMGNLKDLMGMIPGVGKAIKDVEVDETQFKKITCIIQSMTPYERENPEKIDNSRKERIAKGSGKTVQDVNALMKQFDQMKKMMQSMSKMQGGGKR